MTRLKIKITPSLKSMDLVLQGLTTNKFIGNYASVFKGEGLEFSDYRVYTADDDASRIDWKASARANQILVKEYVEERNIDVFFLVDVSAKMMLGSTQKLKAEYVADLVASLSYTILKTNDRVGIGMFADKINKIVYQESGIKHFYSISDSLSNIKYYGGDSNIKRAIEFAIKNLKENSILFIVSDFITEQNFESTLRISGHKFDTTAIIVRDPIDMNLPDGIGQLLVQEPVYGERILISPKNVGLIYSKEARRELAKIKSMFLRSNVDFIELNTATSFVKKIVEFFELRKEKWR